MNSTFDSTGCACPICMYACVNNMEKLNVYIADKVNSKSYFCCPIILFTKSDPCTLCTLRNIRRQ